MGAIRRVEDAVFAMHDRGAFAATVFRYPTIYGPRNPHPWEWTVVRRVLDGRPFVLVPDDGRGTHSRCGHRNAAHSLLLALDHPEAAAGKAYNVADDQVVNIRQWAELTASLAGGGIAVRAFPGEVPHPGWGMIAFGYQGTANCIVDTSAIRRDLGYADVQPLEDGLRETVASMLADPGAYADHPNNVDPFDSTPPRTGWSQPGTGCSPSCTAWPSHSALASPPCPTPQTATGATPRADREDRSC